MSQSALSSRAITDLPSQQSPPVRPVRRWPVKHLAFGALALLGIGFGTRYGVQYWQVGRFNVSTDDAYVQADNTLIAPRVAGYLSDVLVTDNQHVQAGQALAKIDNRDFKTALNQAIADRQTAESEVASIKAQLALQQTAIEQAGEQVASSGAGYHFAQQEQERYGSLARTGNGTVQDMQRTTSELLQGGVAVQHARSAFTAAQQQVDVLKAAVTKSDAQLAHYAAAEDQAQLNLGYTVITAPMEGMIGARSLRVGQYVQGGTQLMAVVPLDAVYVVANYKETQLTDVKPGQRVTIQVDTYPGVVVNGRVDSVSPATGLQFALLPPDNATGNFTKIVQRLPVKIVLDRNATVDGLLRPGMSVEPTIHTHDMLGDKE